MRVRAGVHCNRVVWAAAVSGARPASITGVVKDSSGTATVGLNRPYAGVAGTTVTVNLIEPGMLYGDRINQFDMRFAKGAAAAVCEVQRPDRVLINGVAISVI
jgi:hypothetical protein